METYLCQFVLLVHVSYFILFMPCAVMVPEIVPIGFSVPQWGPGAKPPKGSKG